MQRDNRLGLAERKKHNRRRHDDHQESARSQKKNGDHPDLEQCSYSYLEYGKLRDNDLVGVMLRYSKYAHLPDMVGLQREISTRCTLLLLAAILILTPGNHEHVLQWVFFIFFI